MALPVAHRRRQLGEKFIASNVSDMLVAVAIDITEQPTRLLHDNHPSRDLIPLFNVDRLHHTVL